MKSTKNKTVQVGTDATSDILVTNKNTLIYLVKRLVLFLASLKMLLFEHGRICW